MPSWISIWPRLFGLLDSAIHWIKLYPVDNAIRFAITYPLDITIYPLDSVISPLYNRTLNFNQMLEITVLDVYNEYVWEDITDLAQKDVLPIFFASYMIGQMEISYIRSIAERERGRDFTLEEFHYELLWQGELPLGYLEEHIYIFISHAKRTPQKTPTIEG